MEWRISYNGSNNPRTGSSCCHLKYIQVEQQFNHARTNDRKSQYFFYNNHFILNKNNWVTERTQSDHKSTDPLFAACVEFIPHECILSCGWKNKTHLGLSLHTAQLYPLQTHFVKWLRCSASDSPWYGISPQRAMAAALVTSSPINLNKVRFTHCYNYKTFGF